jgi:enoyl-CoA hydratase/carnithine racemase
MAFVTARLESERLLVITIDRPPVNAIDGQLTQELAAAMAALHTTTATAAVLTAAGRRAFSAGAEMRETLPPDRSGALSERWAPILEQLASSPIPVVAAINGPCIGSAVGLVTKCDIRVAIESATFALPEIRVGFLGGASYLRRLVPESTVRRMVLTGDPISAAEAYNVGLVDYVVPGEAWPDAAFTIARDIADKDDATVRLVKESLDRSEAAGPIEGYAVEQSYTAELRRRGLARSQPSKPKASTA